MRARTLLQLGPQVNWLTLLGPATRGTPGRGTLAEAATAATGARVVVLVPAAEVLLTETRIPAPVRSRLLAALPYALEEQLAAEVDTLHFAAGARDASGRLGVAVVAHERMSGWLEALRQAGIQPELLVPETLALPAPAAGEWRMLMVEGRVLLRSGFQTGQEIDPESLDEQLGLLLTAAGAGEPPDRIVVVCDDLGAMAPVRRQAEGHGVEVEERPLQGALLAQLAAGLDPRSTINLLQGPYAPSHQVTKVWTLWRPAVALLLFWLVLRGVGLVADAVRLNGVAARLDAAIEQEYRGAFPEARKVVNPRVQMERGLEALQQGPTSGSIAGLLGRAAPGLGVSGVKVTSLSYRVGSLDVVLEARDLAAVELAKARLEQARLKVEVISASAREGSVVSRIKVQVAGT